MSRADSADAARLRVLDAQPTREHPRAGREPPMKKTASIVLFTLIAVLSSGPARAETLLFDYVGFDYESPDLNTAQFGEVGSGYVGLGFVPVLYAPLVATPSSNEYTYVISGSLSTSRQVVGDYIIVQYSAGTLAVYEDSKSTGTPANYGVNPPNATAPSTFNDGTLLLLGAIDQFQLVFNLVTNTGSYEATYTVVGGSQLANVPPEQRKGWTFAGTTGNSTQTPIGYDHQVDGQVFVDNPLPARIASWGALKVHYRGSNRPTGR